MNWKISYTIMTSPRKESYLERTIQSLAQTGFFDQKENWPVRLLSSTPDTEHLDSYRKDSRFYIEEMTEKESSERIWSAAGEGLRETWTHYRCLHPDRVNIDSSGVLVLEDDLKFSKTWMKTVSRTVDEIVSLYGRRWLLSLYSPNTKEPLEASRAGSRWLSRPYEGFYGSQAILYPLGVRDEYLAYLTAKPLHNPHDLNLPVVMKDLHIPILTTAPCLVQHAELGDGIHRSESFIELD